MLLFPTDVAYSWVAAAAALHDGGMMNANFAVFTTEKRARDVTSSTAPRNSARLKIRAVLRRPLFLPIFGEKAQMGSDGLVVK